MTTATLLDSAGAATAWPYGLDGTELDKAFRQYLEPLGVKWPDPSQYPGLWLLHQNLNQPIGQSELTDFYRKFGEDYNKQLRHVSAKGWYITTGSKRATRMIADSSLKSSELKLVNVTSPNPLWLISGRLTRMGRTGAADWNELLLRYSSHGCAVCGRKFKHYDKGHLDPAKTATIDNIIPMCTECNNWAGAHNVAFELDGLVARGFRQ